MKSATFLIVLAVFFVSVHTYGQGANPILSMDVITIPIGNNLSQDSLPMITDSTIYQVNMNLSLYDSTDIQNIEVRIGSSGNGVSLLVMFFF
ncbi:MAG: hypothetical protein IPI62_07920 [Bacteroidetes bacterium]|nr:hypothetical protein [Bacteroidota bacterium]